MAGRPKGLPKTGGRKKGSPNKAAVATAAEIAASGLTPLDYMLSVLRDENKSDDERAKMAAAAAPYVHPRIAPVDRDGGPQKIILEFAA